MHDGCILRFAETESDFGSKHDRISDSSSNTAVSGIRPFRAFRRVGCMGSMHIGKNSYSCRWSFHTWKGQMLAETCLVVSSKTQKWNKTTVPSETQNPICGMYTQCARFRSALGRLQDTFLRNKAIPHHWKQSYSRWGAEAFFYKNTQNSKNDGVEADMAPQHMKHRCARRDENLSKPVKIKRKATKTQTRPNTEPRGIPEALK